MSNLVKNELGMKIISTPRIPAIDFVRGLAIILMALDHTSDIWNVGRTSFEGMTSWDQEAMALTNFYRPVFPDFLNFLIRFVTHWCAPTFVFLAGTSIVLFEAKRLELGFPQNEISKHLVIRGLILLLIEWTLIAFVFRVDPFYFGILALLGVGFIIFAFGRRIDPKITLVFSLFLFIEPLIDSFVLRLSSRHFSIFYWGFIFNQFPPDLQNYILTVSFWPNWPQGMYPLDPWLGVMGLGFVFGHWLRRQKLPEDNCLVAKRLALTGGISIGIFLILRLLQGWPINYLGIWTADGYLRPDAFTFETFFLLAKYPPSIGFLLWTLGGMCLALAFAFHLQNWDWFQNWTLPIVLFGSTPLFFYSVHLIIYGAVPFLLDSEKAFSLQITLLVWILGLVILYPICHEFRKLKKRYPDSPLKYI